MTAERKASIKGTVTLAFSGASVGLLLWIGGTMARIDHALTYSTNVQDIADWQASIERANGTAFRVPDFWAIWERNHKDRKSIFGAMP